MSLRPVPWFTGNGAENHAELARAALYASTAGATGIGEPNDFRTTELPVPGAAVRVRMGAGIIKSTYPNVFGQSYAVQEDSFTDVPITSTGSSGGAVKYLYVLIEDTQYTGQTPADIANGPYNSYHVSTTLPANEPHLPLYRIDQPAETATITNSMLTDLREVANPKTQDILRVKALVTGEEEVLVTDDVDKGEYFPNNGGPQQIDIPVWATRALVEVEWIQTRYAAGNAWGQVWFEYGPYESTSVRERKSQRMQWDTGGSSGVSRGVMKVVDDVYIPASYRGTRQQFVPKATRVGGVNNSVSMDAMSAMLMRIRFLQVADSSTS